MSEPSRFHKILSAALLVLAAAAVRPADSPTAGSDPLRFRPPVVSLPRAHRGMPYGQRIEAWGGIPPRKFTLVSGVLPEALMLESNGQLRGSPATAGVYDFTIEARDSGVPPGSAQQSFELRVEVSQGTPAQPPFQSEHVAVNRTPTLPLQDPEALAADTSGAIVTYQLTQANVDALAPAAAASTPTPTSTPAAAPITMGVGEPATDEGSSADQAKQLRAALLLLVGVDYPSISLFVRAVSAVAPPRTALATIPTVIRPNSEWGNIIQTAQKRHELTKPNAIQWSGDGCGCVRQDFSQEVYGIYPFWLAGGAAQSLDFGTLTRVGYFALQFDNDGNIQNPLNWTNSGADFIRVAQTYGTKVDLVLYRNDWTQLLSQPEDKQAAVIDNTAGNLMDLVNTPLTNWAARMKEHVPFFRSTPFMGDGITVYFDSYPAQKDKSFNSFNVFFRRLIVALIDKMRQTNYRKYVLNIVVADQLLGKPGAYDFDAMLEYIKLAEDPYIKDGRISQDDGVYRSRTNIEVHFLVLLGQKTTNTKKALRLNIEDAPALHGNDRRVFLRKVIPIVSYDGSNPVQFEDDLVYFEDNFEGAGFWPVPIAGVGAGSKVYDSLNDDYRTAGSRATSGLCKFVCPHRWPLRVLFEVLLVIGLVSFGLYIWVCRVRSIGNTYIVLMLLGGVPTLLIGAALLDCDPDLERLRRGNALLAILIGALLLWALYVNLQKPVENP